MSVDEFGLRVIAERHLHPGMSNFESSIFKPGSINVRDDETLPFQWLGTDDFLQYRRTDLNVLQGQRDRVAVEREARDRLVRDSTHPPHILGKNEVALLGRPQLSPMAL